MAKLTKTSAAGIYRRHTKGCDGTGRCECSYVVTWRHGGRQHTETQPTMAAARDAKKLHEADVARGEFSDQSRMLLHRYLKEWIERYQGSGRRGFREETRDDYRWNLNRYALEYFDRNLRLTDLDPRRVADFVGWLTRQKTKRDRPLSDSAVRNAFKPLSVGMATARREGLIRNDPTLNAVLPFRESIEEDEGRARPFPKLVDDDGDDEVETMELVVALVHSDHRLMFELLAATGLRRSELLALYGRHLKLGGVTPHLQVRQRIRRRKGHGLVVGPLKSKYGRRDLPIPIPIADRLRALRTPAGGFVFHTEARGGPVPLDADNLAERVLGPACEEAGVGWAGFHTFRHTVASRLFAEGRNAVQVQRWLGHHSPSFTLDQYVHLLDSDLGEPLAALRVNTGSTEGTQTNGNRDRAESTKTAA